MARINRTATPTKYTPADRARLLATGYAVVDAHARAQAVVRTWKRLGVAVVIVLAVSAFYSITR